MSDAPTPETDALANGRIGMWQHNLPADFARKLERERDEAREALSGRTVSCAQCNKSAKKLEAIRELLREIRDDEVNAQDEADKFLRDHAPSELSKMREAIKAAHDALRAWPKAGHGMSTDHTLQSQAFRTGQAALAKLKPFLP